ncbi:hypothetical protein COO60DRAFT_1523788 [Scenedesmus sp. NREL 46B-D3]|nr:hypothetical protein COO60DRAFT_1523788 [Scenedesmus sp. NREL 46B-D3]
MLSCIGDTHKLWLSWLISRAAGWKGAGSGAAVLLSWPKNWAAGYRRAHGNVSRWLLHLLWDLSWMSLYQRSSVLQHFVDTCSTLEDGPSKSACAVLFLLVPGSNQEAKLVCIWSDVIPACICVCYRVHCCTASRGVAAFHRLTVGWAAAYQRSSTHG